jgi:hypothetical protein
MIIWLSPGWAMLSGPNVIVTAKSEQWLFRNIVTLSQEIRGDAEYVLSFAAAPFFHWRSRPCHRYAT